MILHSLGERECDLKICEANKIRERAGIIFGWIGYMVMASGGIKRGVYVRVLPFVCALFQNDSFDGKLFFLSVFGIRIGKLENLQTGHMEHV